MIRTRMPKGYERSCRMGKNRFILSICWELEEHSIHRFKAVKYGFLNTNSGYQRWTGKQEEKPREHHEDTERRRYFSNFFKDAIGGDYQPAAHDLEPDVLRLEVENTIGKLRNKRSPGTDSIPAETFKSMGTTSFGRFAKNYEESKSGLKIGMSPSLSPFTKNLERASKKIFNKFFSFLNIFSELILSCKNCSKLKKFWQKPH